MKGILNRGINRIELVNNIRENGEGIEINKNYINKLKKEVSYEEALMFLCMSTVEIYGLENEIERLNKELEIEKDISDGMLETIDKAIEYIEDKWEMELKDSIEDFLDHDERIERKRLLHILEILKKEENNEIKSS